MRLAFLHTILTGCLLCAGFTGRANTAARPHALHHHLFSAGVAVALIGGLHNGFGLGGTFRSLKTRAFLPVKEGLHTPLADMLSLQQFFTLNDSRGDLLGCRLPAFMDNTNTSGYHFHYLPAAKDAGGHIIDLQAEDIRIETDTLHSYSIYVPPTADYEHFDFKKNRGKDIKSVERGGKTDSI